MSSKTKIVVLHMKEVVYTAVFLALALILLVVFLIMFSGKKDSAKKPSVTTAASAENARYIPGIYTSTISLGDQTFDVQVNVHAGLFGVAMARNSASLIGRLSLRSSLRVAASSSGMLTACASPACSAAANAAFRAMLWMLPPARLKRASFS